MGNLNLDFPWGDWLLGGAVNKPDPKSCPISDFCISLTVLEARVLLPPDLENPAKILVRVVCTFG
jgi:hypothetical protein